MSIWDLLERIRNRPVQEKRLLSFFIAAGMTAVITISWATVTIGGAVGGDEKKEVVEERSSPFAAIGAQFKILKEELSTMKEDTGPVRDELTTIKDDFVDIVKNGTSSSSTLKYLQAESFDTETETGSEIIIEAEIENTDTGTSTQETETGEIEQSN